MNLFGFVGDDPIKHSDYLGWDAQPRPVVPVGFIGVFSSRDQAGYYGSRAASMLTEKDEGEREFCGIICCRDGVQIISRPHAGNPREWAIESGIKKFKRTPSCNCRLSQGRLVACPDSTWSLSGTYHSHPVLAGGGSDLFGGHNDIPDASSDYDVVNKPGGVSLYLGTPSGKVKRLDRDEKGEHKKAQTLPGVKVPDSWNYEEKWRKSHGQ